MADAPTTPEERATADPAIDVSSVHYWQLLRVRDARTMTAFLQSIGFREHATVTEKGDPSRILHAEWVWERGGGVMLSSMRADRFAVGPSGAVLVCPDPDDVLRRAVAAGATAVQPVEDQPFGGRSGTVRDPEGNLWNFSSYQPT